MLSNALQSLFGTVSNVYLGQFNLVLTGGLVALIYLAPRAVLGIFIADGAVLDLAKG